MNPQLRSELLDMIAANEMDNAILKLREIFRDTDTEKEIIHQSARLREIENQYSMGLAPFQDYLRERNIVQDALIELVLLQSGASTDEPPNLSVREKLQVALKRRYVIRKKLGEGSISEVYLAYDIHLKRRAAVKVLKNQEFFTPKISEKINNDVIGGAQYKHRNIMTIYEAQLGENPRFIILEYVDGPDLAYLLEQTGKLSLRESMAFIWQVGRALEYGHRRNKFHGRVRPSNILVDEENQCVLSSFRVVEDKRNHPEFLKMAENNRYWAPEQFDGITNEYSDQFSLGLTAFEMINGQPLFEGKSAPEIFESRAKFFADPNQVFFERSDKLAPTSLLSVILKMLEKDPKNRWQDIREATRELEKIDLERDDYIQIAKNSFKRIRHNNEFLAKFYENFFAHPNAAAMKPLFSNLDRQYQMLRQAMHRLLEFATPNESKRGALESMARVHAEKNIPTDLFPLFMETFIRTAAQFDPKWDADPTIELSWTRASGHGLEAIMKMTGEFTGDVPSN